MLLSPVLIPYITRGSHDNIGRLCNCMLGEGNVYVRVCLRVCGHMHVCLSMYERERET